MTHKIEEISKGGLEQPHCEGKKWVSRQTAKLREAGDEREEIAGAEQGHWGSSVSLTYCDLDFTEVWGFGFWVWGLSVVVFEDNRNI